MRSGWLFPHCIAVAVLAFSVFSGSLVLGDDADRAKKLEELEKSHKETVADLQKELNKQLAIYDSLVAKQEKLSRKTTGPSPAGVIKKYEKRGSEALQKGKPLREQIDKLTFQYEQNRRRIILKNPQPGDPPFVESEGLVYTAEELKELEELRRNHGSPEVVADAYVQTLIKNGVLETATRTGTRPFQLTNGPPQPDKMMVFYQCRYTSRGGFVNNREGYVLIAQDERGFWFVSGITQLEGIIF